MADSIDFDFSELNALAADLGEAADGIAPFLESAVKFTSVNVKRAAARKVGQRRHFKQAARAIDFDVKHFKGFGVEVIQSEIGYDKHKPSGELGNLVEFGAPGAPNALTPGNELQTSLHENEEDFVYGVERAVDDAMRKAGL